MLPPAAGGAPPPPPATLSGGAHCSGARETRCRADAARQRRLRPAAVHDALALSLCGDYRGTGRRQCGARGDVRSDWPLWGAGGERGRKAVDPPLPPKAPLPLIGAKQSIKYLVDEGVIDYIRQHRLYVDVAPTPAGPSPASSPAPEQA